MTENQHINLLPVSAPGDNSTDGDFKTPPCKPAGLEGYQILDLLGEGGMGTVWRAIQLSTRRQVALKLMQERVLASGYARARFEREIEITSRLEHPNIARVYDSGLFNGVYYYAMELIDGEPLDRYVRAHKLGRVEILQLMLEVCRAVSYAHQQGVLHRDLKPSNILISTDGKPRVIDFGLASHAEIPSDPAISVDGSLRGTLAYMSPEQAAGRASAVDVRSEVYTCGVILFELTCGTSPHNLSGDQFEWRTRIVHGDIRRPRQVDPTVDRTLEAILLKSVAHEPEHRYASVAELAMDIDRYLSGDVVEARPLTLGYLITNRVRRHRVRVALAALVVLALLIINITWYVHLHRARKQAEVSAESSRRSLYLTRIALATTELPGGDANQVKQILRACPTDLRRWEWYQLDALADQSVRTFSPGGFVLGARFVGQGSHIATFGVDGTLGWWNPRTGKCVSTVHLDHPGRRRPHLSPDGRLVAIGQMNASILVFDAHSGTLLTRLRGSIAEELCWCENGRWLASLDNKHVLHLWDVSSGREINHWSTGVASRSLVAADEGQILGCTGSQTIIWNAAAAQEVCRLPTTQFPGDLLAIDSSAKHAAVIDEKGNLSVWDIPTRREVFQVPIDQSTARRICFSPDGSKILTGDDKGLIKVWSASDGAFIRSLVGHSSGVQSLDFISGRRILSSGHYSAKLWDMSLPQDGIRTFTATIGHSSKVITAVDPTGRVAAFADEDHLQIVHLASDAKSTISASFLKKEPLYFMRFSRTGRLLAISMMDGSIQLWNVKPLSLHATISMPKSVDAIAFSQDDHYLAFADDTSVTVCGLTEGFPMHTIDATMPIAWLSRRNELVCRNHAGSNLVIVDNDSWYPRPFVDHKVTVSDSISIDPIGQHLCIAKRHELDIWSTQSGRLLRTIRVPDSESICAIRLNHDGSRILTTGSSVSLWDTDSGTKLVRFRSRADDVYGWVDFCGKGRIVAAGTATGAITTWSSIANHDQDLK